MGCHQNSHLQRSWNKYGESCFNFVCLELCDESELNSLEQKYIEQLETTDSTKGYNKESGGHVHRLISEETRRKMSEAKIGLYDGEKNPMYGVHLKHTDEWKKKNSERVSGKGNPMYGVHLKKTEAEVREMSERARGENNSFYGKRHTQETKEKMHSNRKNKRAVRCVETGDVYSMGFEAQKITGIHSSSISRSCKNPHIKAGTYHWEYVA